MAYKVFSNGNALNASELNTYLMNQSVMVFASTSARDAAITSPSEGMLVWLEDSNKYVYYNGSAWTDFASGSNGSNVVINGGFDIWQRGTSFANSHVFTADRWKTDGATAVYVGTFSQLAVAPGEISGFNGAYAGRLNVTNVNGATKIQLLHRVEDVRTLADQNVTLSFWAKADAAKTLSIKLSQQFGSGGSSSVDTTAQNASVTTSWQRFTLTYSLASIVGKTIGAGNFILIEFNYPLSTFTLDITGVQLEAGSVASAFKRSGSNMQEELANCQRYYYRMVPNDSGEQYTHYGVGSAYSTTNARVFVKHPVSMRTKPSSIDFSNVAVYDTVTFTAASTVGFQGNQNNSDSSVISIAVASGLTQFRPYTATSNNTASSYIGFSAEL